MTPEAVLLFGEVVLAFAFTIPVVIVWALWG